MAMRILLAACAFIGTALAAEWTYFGTKGASNWEKDYSTCKGERQSPINIYEGDVVKSTTLGAISFTNYDATTGLIMTLENNGHSVNIGYGGSTTKLSISGSDLPGTFQVAGFHFHWGSRSQEGSEHFINMRRYPMEMHIVHYNTKYADINAAIDKSDGLAVIGSMFEISNSDNAAFNTITSNLNRVQQKDATFQITSFALETLLPSTAEYYRYPGGLTTPACYQSVTWTVLKEPVKISEAQLAEFRKLLDKNQANIEDNNRPIQAISGRTVESNFDSHVKWGYEQPSKYVTPPTWGNYYEECSGASQSPINIPKFDTEIDNSLGSFTFTNYDTTSGLTMSLANNGHTAGLSWPEKVVTVSGGGLPDTYVLAGLHFHWGSTMEKGSEHLLYGKAFPMEIHLVHVKQSLGGTVADALASNDTEAIAVLGFFFEERATDNPGYTSLVSALPGIKDPTGVAKSFSTITINSLLTDKRDHFFRYSGSLTTPTCNQQVVWTVFGDTIPISPRQLNAFRSILSAEKDDLNQYIPLVNNYRPVQALNLRPVKVHVPKWGYRGDVGAASWGKYYPYCDNTPSSRQSPIDLNPLTIHLDVKLRDFKFTPGFNEKVLLTMTNNGHTVESTFDNSKMTLTGGGLEGSYRPAQFHFHWGSDNMQGSEHTIAERKFPMEMHIVFANEKYAFPSPAVTQSDGLAVLGFMFEIGDVANAAFDPIIAKLADVKEPGQTAAIPNVNLTSLMADNLGDYYRYDGSLTTPGCYQSVKWTVFRDTIKISQSQMDKFRLLKSSEKMADKVTKYPLVNNYRPVQPKNQRRVSANFLIGASVSVTFSSLTVVLCVIVALAQRLS